ncbi:MAG: LytTR family transcriptional regulator DNA-binding domain-containing protein [Flavobacterium sp.]|nr:LytTR family transcriptional regulator DNA-binding domain-containing protein [Flavobacterium sp.]
MEKIKVVIIDDEILARNLLKEYLLDHENFTLIAECKNGIEAIGVINALQPDLIFLDIQMPGKTGFEVLQEIDFFPKIIFSTAYDSFALQAFEVNAIDYLLKPYTKVRFENALQKIKIHDSYKPENIINLLDAMPIKTYSKTVLVQKGTKLCSILTDDIIYIEALDDYAMIYTKDDSFLANKGLGAIHAKLNPELFIRVHRSFVVSIHHIAEINKDIAGYQIITSNAKKINVSRTYVDVITNLKL